MLGQMRLGGELMSAHVTLTTFVWSGLTLEQALSRFAELPSSPPAVAILYSPRRCELATFAEGLLRGPNGQPIDTTTIFEARVFHQTAELRWLNDPSPQALHRAVILIDPAPATFPKGWDEGESEQHAIAVIETLPQTALLWGQGTGRPISDGWSELATARIGRLLVPLAGVNANQRVLLHSLEYVVAEEEDGNAVIFDERLVKLEVDRG